MNGGEEILSIAEMATADSLAVTAGVPYLTLMENAGRAVAIEAAKLLPPGGDIRIICGPGNNGGDGFVAARYLRGWGFPITVACLVPVASLNGCAAEMARRWDGAITEDWPDALAWGADVIIDAIFGAGLSRPPEGDFAGAIEIINQRRIMSRIVAVDVPSGVHGDTGRPLGALAVEADCTVTFFRRKPAHVLLPGRKLCGDVVVADIGIPDAIFDQHARGFGDGFTGLDCRARINRPTQLPRLIRAGSATHKYMRGHAVVVSGPPEQTGAARLGARSALRAGAGLVTVASPRPAFPINAVHLTAVMVAPFDAPDGLAAILADRRRNAVLIGPGCGVDETTRAMVAMVLQSGAAAVLDADALTAFAATPANADAPEPIQTAPAFGFLPSSRTGIAANPETLFKLTRDAARTRPIVMTPHAGEFQRLFGPAQDDESKLARTRRAAADCGAVVVFKGADTVIAAPDGNAAINDNAPPWLATAGSGDVLAGFVTGILAQGLGAFDAACAAVWLHGECATLFGPGLIAEDLPEILPRVFRALIETP